MARQLNSAVIGCGRIGSYTRPELKQTLLPHLFPLNHAEAFCSLDQYILDALCDVDEMRLREAGERYSIEQLYTDYQDLLEVRKPDVVSVATRTSIREEIVLSAVDAGVLGMHIEKPISRTVEGCRRILSCLAKRNVRFTYGTVRRWSSMYLKAKELLLQGAIGSLKHIRVNFGKANLLWTHPHSVDILIFFSQSREIEYVTSACDMRHCKISDSLVDGDPVVLHALMKFKNGIYGEISLLDGKDVILEGDRGVIVIRKNSHELMIARKNEETKSYADFQDISVFSPHSGTQLALLDIYHSITNNTSTAITFDEILMNQKILTAVVTSAMEKSRKVSMNELDERLEISGRLGELYA